ncbi:hypothetical protein DDV21_006530 [Streptococcus chenjunshii]|uniref:Uncharacterized protein n=1 Tax=Streptococcus chenjunshii TaxID=2173853 RepID=A0A372KPR5_9STRE|nr:hypothetical protein DDV21_006530 [Streptococcus chenjunshii]RFU51645.1 hypothetical protein DDV22_02010 [Streptococcus chenjunshii]RFU53966.1 hypothetical protein DDV23_00070 [Streptococcus chenjunshii]
MQIFELITDNRMSYQFCFQNGFEILCKYKVLDFMNALKLLFLTIKYENTDTFCKDIERQAFVT